MSFGDTLDQLTNELGFRLESITPADDPVRAVLTRGETQLILERKPEPDLRSIDGLVIPDLVERFEIAEPAEDGWTVGRAGMRYRDLLPSRLGGRFIASNIEVCDGGPVPDLVHHHAIRFQIIVCERGWVDVVYEDQGPPLRMEPGDVVLQPPHIRHRVLASSPGARVVEIGCPTEHDTLFDHELELPNDGRDPDRAWSGQRFVHHVARTAPWLPAEHGGEEQVTDIDHATGGLADVRILRARPDDDAAVRHPSNRGELDFMFVLDGSAGIEVDGQTHEAAEGFAMAIRGDQGWTLAAASSDARILQVRLPA